MKLYKYIIKNSLNKNLNETGIGELFDLETVVPIEILSILELFDDEAGELNIKVDTENVSHDICKIG
ncbi:hypothetical protein [Aquimarina longa]|uniref:hypothetical protein n=1 Tax=Aquimarina longa TaxID=1080221 RepID=UPI0007830E4D|nr:hypothetical protein [Aquimarina longa]